jgi:hypothetical protein
MTAALLWQLARKRFAPFSCCSNAGSAVSRILLLQIVWYELPSFYVFHIANAWEEGGKVKMVACQAERVDLNAMKFSEDMGENAGVNLSVKLIMNLSV